MTADIINAYSANHILVIILRDIAENQTRALSSKEDARSTRGNSMTSHQHKNFAFLIQSLKVLHVSNHSI